MNQSLSNLAGAHRQVVAPEKDFVFHFARAVVDESISWYDALEAGCPQTPQNSSVYEASGRYRPSPGAGSFVDQYLLVCTNDLVHDLDEVRLWARRERYLTTTPRDLFALALDHPRLNQEFEYGRRNSLLVYATYPQRWWWRQKTQICARWTHEGHRIAEAHKPSEFGSLCAFLFKFPQP